METKAAYSQPLYLHLLRLPFTPFPPPLAPARTPFISLAFRRSVPIPSFPTYIRDILAGECREKILRTVPESPSSFIRHEYLGSLDLPSGRGRRGWRRNERMEHARGKEPSSGVRDESAQSVATPADIANPAISFSNLP